MKIDFSFKNEVKKIYVAASVECSVEEIAECGNLENANGKLLMGMLETFSKSEEAYQRRAEDRHGLEMLIEKDTHMNNMRRKEEEFKHQSR